MVFPHLSLLVHFENSARENDLNSSLEPIVSLFWSQKHELQALPTKSDSYTDLGQCGHKYEAIMKQITLIFSKNEVLGPAFLFTAKPL